LNKEDLTLQKIEIFLCKLCKSIIEDFRLKNIKSNYFEEIKNPFLEFEEENIINFEDLIKNFLKKSMLKKLKRFYNDKSLKNCEPKFSKILEFMEKYSIENLNSIDDIDNINKDICYSSKIEFNEDNFSQINVKINDNSISCYNNYSDSNKSLKIFNSNSNKNININLQEFIPEKKFNVNKLPFKVTQMKDIKNNNINLNINNNNYQKRIVNENNKINVNNNNNILNLNLNPNIDKTIFMTKLNENKNIFNNYQNSKNINNLIKDNMHVNVNKSIYSLDNCDYNFFNFVNILSIQNKDICYLGEIFKAIRDDLKNQN
jgi:hypothetical protein